MSYFGDIIRPIGRKQYRCEYCYGTIPIKEKHVQFKGQWEGEWQNWRMHNECYKSYLETGEECFCPGDGEIPDRVKAMKAESNL